MRAEIPLAAHEAAAVTAYITRLRQRLDGKLLTVILYGSKARGDAAPTADIDLLTVVSNDDEQAAQAAAELAYELAYTHNVPLSPLIISARRYRELPTKRFTFYRNLRRDGYTLYPIDRAASRVASGVAAVKTSALSLGNR